MKTMKLWMMAAILAVCGNSMLTSCSDSSIDNPVTPTPEPEEDTEWTAEANMDTNYLPGDNFFMHAIGKWWDAATVDPQIGCTSFGIDLETKGEAMLELVKDDLTSMRKHCTNLTANATADAATLGKAENVIRKAQSREELWRVMGELKKQGYQLPFHLVALSTNGKMRLVFVPVAGCDFADAQSSGSGDDYNYGGGNYSYPSIVKSKQQNPWLRLITNPRLEDMLVPVRRGGATRGFQQESWPMLVGVCEGLGVSPDDAYVLQEAFDGMQDDMEDAKPGSLENLTTLQEMDTETLRQTLLAYVGDDRLLFDENTISLLGRLSADDITSALQPRYMLYWLSQLFAEKYITPQMRDRSVEYTRELVATFRSRIESNDWLSDGSKANAIEKLEAMNLNVACPDFYAEGLPDLSQTSSALEDALELRRTYTALMLKLTGMDIADGSFHSLVASFSGLWVGNAFYAPNFNSINILPLWLMAPAYDERAVDAYNYATLMVFGHEITHGFDTGGAQWNKIGDRGSIWASEADAQEFSRRAQLLADYYSSVELLPGVYADGEKTLAENIADLGGLEISLQAFTTHMQQEGVTGDELRQQQKNFFYAYAYLWRAKYNEDYVLKMLKEDVHSQSCERVNCVLANIDLWYDLFDVKPGQKLYRAPEDRVHIW